MSNTTRGTFSSPFFELLVVGNVFVLLLCVVSNFLVVYTLIKERLIRKPFEYILFHLAISDIGFVLLNTFYNLVYLLNNYSWPFGVVLCKLTGPLYYYFYWVGVIDILLISCIRFKAVVFPLRAQITLTKVKRFITASNLLLFATYYIYLAVILESADGVCFPKLPDSRSLEILIYIEVVFFNIFPAFLLVLTNSTMAMILCRRSREAELHSVSKKVRRKLNIKAVKISVSIMLLYLLASAPIVITRIHIVGSLRDGTVLRTWIKDFFSWISILSMLLSNCSGAFIYAIFNANIRRGYTKAIKNILL